MRFLSAFFAALMLTFMVRAAWAAPDPVHSFIYKQCLVEFGTKTKAQEKANYYAPLITRVATKHGLEPMLVASLVWTESNFRPDCVSPAGALGLGQVMPFHWKSHGYSIKRWRDPEINLTLSCRIFKGMLDDINRRYRGLPYETAVQRALVSYNMGPGAVSRGIYRSHYSRAVWVRSRSR